MLVLSRRSKEQIDFPGLGISIEVLQIKGSTVRLGIKAPSDVRVLRGELVELRSQWDDYEVEVPIKQLHQSILAEAG